jgi:hypothetical protein
MGKFHPTVTPESPEAFVLAHGAMFVAVRWEVSKQPQREGAVAVSDLTPAAVTSEEADEALRSPASFDRLFKRRTVAHAICATILQPVNGIDRAVPVLVQPSVSGSAIASVQEEIERVAATMEEFGAKDAGRAHDGDRAFTTDLGEQAERVLSRMWELVGNGGVLKATCTALIEVLPPDKLRDYFDQWRVEKNTRSAIIGSDGGEGGVWC